MTYECDFEKIKRAYAEMARRARDSDKQRRESSHAAEEDTKRPSVGLRNANETYGVSGKGTTIEPSFERRSHDRRVRERRGVVKPGYKKSPNATSPRE